MRVRKVCTECGKLKSMWDFLPSEEFLDKRTRECKICIEEEQFSENNSKINNNQTIKTMATLAEKRKAAEAAKANGTTTEAPVTPKTATLKVGEKTKKGDTVVGEKKEPGKKGRKAYVEKPIEQLDLATGTQVIATHNTLKEAADAVGTSTSYLLDGLRGWAKSVAKFKWRYQGEEIVVRVPKEKSTAEKAFVAAGKVEDVPVPGDLDYDPELHAPKTEAEEEEDNSVFEPEAEE